MKKKIIKLKESDLERLVQKILKEDGEDRGSRYMFFSNLKQIHRQATMLMDMDQDMLEQILEDGHDWAQDHIAEAKSLLDQVFDFIKNEVKSSGDDELDESLWKNIHAKRKRGEKPAKPDDDDYPDKKTWNKLTKESKSPCWDGYEKVPGKKDFEKGSCRKKKTNEQISENLKYHLDNKIPLSENIFRYGSKSYLNILKETRSLYFKGKLKLDKEDEEFIISDVGTKDIYEGKEVWLDTPFEYGDVLSEAEYKGTEVELNKPSRNSGEGKKYMVYVKDPSSGNVRKISFGDKKGGLTAKVSNPEARKSFAARHKCSEKKDKLSSGYWACRLTKFGHLFNGKTYPGYW